MDPKAEVTLLEQDTILSYGICGLPYYVSGDVKDLRKLYEGPIRDANYWKSVKDITMHNRTRVTSIDRENKIVKAINMETKEEVTFPYDKLMIATGAKPFVPPIENLNMDQVENVFTVRLIEDVDKLVKKIKDLNVQNAVIIGGGLIGIEMAEGLRGANIPNVSLVELAPQVLGVLLDWEMAKFVQNKLEEKNIKILLEDPLTKVTRKENGNLITGIEMKSGKQIPCDLLICALGVRPRSELAKDAGLNIGKSGGIIVNEYMQTNDPDIYAAGDCIETTNIITGMPMFAPMGSSANKQGRIAAQHMVEGVKGARKWKGVMGSTLCKVFDLNVATTGLTERQARAAGFDVETCIVPSADKPGFMPNTNLMRVKLVADKTKRTLLGAQVIGAGDVARRIDVAAMAIATGMTVDQIGDIDLAYAPPYGGAIDVICTAANVMSNILDGKMEHISPIETKRKIDSGEDVFLLDVRNQDEWDEFHLENSTLIPLPQIRNRLDEIPRDKEIITYCRVSLRAYEAYCYLKSQNFTNIKVMDGGLISWPFEMWRKQ